MFLPPTNTGGGCMYHERDLLRKKPNVFIFSLNGGFEYFFPEFNVLSNQKLSWPLMAICSVLITVLHANSSYISFSQLHSLNFTFVLNFIGDLLSF